MVQNQCYSGSSWSSHRDGMSCFWWIDGNGWSRCQNTCMLFSGYDDTYVSVEWRQKSVVNLWNLQDYNCTTSIPTNEAIDFV
ncbi:hypothetical protein Hdeb2414_s0003g00114841 [Helianthus debilis subsp. tardiflorus]